MEIDKNNSGEGRNALIPENLKGWNWGAFALNWIWSLVHNTWIGLLILVPFILWIITYAFTENDDAALLLSLIPILMIISGIKGNEWAWQNNKWRSHEHFRNSQKIWARWGIVIIIVWILLVVLGVSVVYVL